MQEAQIESRLAQVFDGLSPTEFAELWETLVAEGHVQDLAGRSHVQAAWRAFVRSAERIRLRGTQGAPHGAPPVKGSQRDPSVEPARQAQRNARARVLAACARSHKGVRDFRREVLDGMCLPPGDVRAWIEEAAAADGLPTVYASAKVGESEVANRSFAFPAILDYRTRDAVADLSTPVAFGGVLDRLRLLAEDLSHAFAWRAAAACWFVLTDEVLRQDTRVRVTWSLGDHVQPRVDIEPAPDMTVEEGSAAFHAARQLAGLPARSRPMEAKALALAELVSSHPEDDNRELLRLWNRTVPDPAWRYDDDRSGRSNFRRHCKDAVNRLLGRVPLASFPEGYGYLGDPADALREPPWVWERDLSEPHGRCPD